MKETREETPKDGGGIEGWVSPEEVSHTGHQSAGAGLQHVPCRQEQTWRMINDSPPPAASVTLCRSSTDILCCIQVTPKFTTESSKFKNVFQFQLPLIKITNNRLCHISFAESSVVATCDSAELINIPSVVVVAV